MNLPGLELPMPVIAAHIIVQHNAVAFTHRSNFAIFHIDPDDAMLIKINDNTCIDEREASIAVLIFNATRERLVRNNDIVTVRSKELFSRVVLDDVTAVVIAIDVPLHNGRLAKAKLHNG